MEQQVRLLLVMPASLGGVQVQVLASLFPIQFFAHASRNAAEGGTSAWATASHGEARTEFLALSFSLLQTWLLLCFPNTQISVYFKRENRVSVKDAAFFLVERADAVSASHSLHLQIKQNVGVLCGCQVDKACI